MAKHKGDVRLTDDDIANKLEPYLKIGLPMSVACQQAGISRETVRVRCAASPSLLAKLNSFRTYKAVLYGNITYSKLAELSEEITVAKKQGRSTRQVLTRNDFVFLRDVGKNDKVVRMIWVTDDDEDTEPPYAFQSPRNPTEAKLQEQVLNKHHDYVAQKRAARAAADDRED